MSPENLEIDCAIQIQKPIQEVFEAIVNPELMSQYFIGQSNGRMQSGKELLWKFPEFDTNFPIKVGAIELNQSISFYWTMDSIETKVQMNLIIKENNTTLVSINEKSRINDAKGIQWLSGNSFGWSNFLACLKAYLEYGINLRKGAFDFMKK
jgi:uncharacterized protein YndB with AHSA1/START domain